jgi:protein gp37
MHAILVRPRADRFQIIDGHHRVESARREKLVIVPAWVREMTDEEAFMQLALANAQTGLTPLERGRHALMATTRSGKNGGTSITKYAEQIGRKEQSVRNESWAYEVFQESTNVGGLEKYFAHLVAIHAAPRDQWQKLAERMVEHAWSVRDVEAAVKELQPKRAKRDPTLITAVTLADWKRMKPARQTEILDWREREYNYRFNEQKNDYVEWARSSHNPVTGCLHNCPYCYAREIAEHIYPEKFEPVLHVDRLIAPYTTPVPTLAAQDMSYRNVFICSMADLFGQWVPKEWIEAVLETVRDNPQWNFLFLTKFPIRMAEFEYPPNAWLGTTVDLQARVKNAEQAMRKVKASVKWLSIEPLLEPLRFEDLSAFEWVVIGGASQTDASTGPTPEWRPPRRWVLDLTLHAMDAGCLVYHKTNLNNDRLKQFPNDPNAEREPEAAPPVFQYLKVIA